MTHLFTSESVSMGHPDKVSDQISDAILDAMLVEDPRARVACETLVTTGMAVIAGEVTCDGYVEIADIVRNVVRDIGYDDGAKGFDYESCAVLVALGKQSPDIARGVNESDDRKQGAGDQGMMFGFACRETEDLAPGTFMPLPIFIAHRLVEKHTNVRRSNLIPNLRPDAKSQVTVEYDGDRPTRIDTLVLSTQHGPEWNDDQKGLKEAVIEHILKPTLADQWNDDVTIHVNPTGRFEIGGPQGDAGLTGRKIIVDTYGGRGRHGGGAFSGKDPSKVDRSATYMARYIAKNLVAAGLADICEVQLSYAIGVAEPTSVHVDCMGTEKVDPSSLATLVREHFDLTPAGIIRSLDLLRPIYRPTSYHGHFGRVPEQRTFEYTKNGSTREVNAGETFPWEKTDKANVLKSAAGSYATAGA